LLRLENWDVLFFVGHTSNSELGTVAISLFFAFLQEVGSCLLKGAEERSLDSRWSLGLPILVGSAVAITLFFAPPPRLGSAREEHGLDLEKSLSRSSLEKLRLEWAAFFCFERVTGISVSGSCD
jgi:hypothetical protein